MFTEPVAPLSDDGVKHLVAQVQSAFTDHADQTHFITSDESRSDTAAKLAALRKRVETTVDQIRKLEVAVKE